MRLDPTNLPLPTPPSLVQTRSVCRRTTTPTWRAGTAPR